MGLREDFPTEEESVAHLGMISRIVFRPTTHCIYDAAFERNRFALFARIQVGKFRLLELRGLLGLLGLLGSFGLLGLLESIGLLGFLNKLTL